MAEEVSTTPGAGKPNALNEAARLARQGGSVEMQHLLEQSEKVVRYQASRIHKRHPSFNNDDLKQVGLQAIGEALRLWKPERSAFGTFASLVIRCRLLACVNKRYLDDVTFDEGRDVSDSQSATQPIEIADILAHVIEHLTDKEVAIVRSIAEGLTYEETGKTVGLSADGVHSVLFRLRTRLKHLNPFSTNNDDGENHGHTN